jgi:hypothetical protein
MNDERRHKYVTNRGFLLCLLFFLSAASERVRAHRVYIYHSVLRESPENIASSLLLVELRVNEEERGPQSMSSLLSRANFPGGRRADFKDAPNHKKYLRLNGIRFSQFVRSQSFQRRRRNLSLI